MISEKKFYEMCAKGAQVSDDITMGYYPTVDELIKKGVDKNPEKYLPILTYFAQDPFTKRDDVPAANDIEYKKMVKYVNELLNSIELINDDADD